MRGAAVCCIAPPIAGRTRTTSCSVASCGAHIDALHRVGARGAGGDAGAARQRPGGLADRPLADPGRGGYARCCARIERRRTASHLGTSSARGAANDAPTHRSSARPRGGTPSCSPAAAASSPAPSCTSPATMRAWRGWPRRWPSSLPEAEVLRFPAWDCLPYDRVSPNPALVSERIATLARLLEKPTRPAHRADHGERAGAARAAALGVRRRQPGTAQPTAPCSRRSSPASWRPTATAAPAP